MNTGFQVCHILGMHPLGYDESKGRHPQETRHSLV